MNRPNRLLLGIVVVVAIAGAASTHALGQQSSIQGYVTDPDGAAVINARILVHWDSSGSSVGLTDNVGISQDATTSTDNRGHFSIAVPPGFYDLFVTKTAFTPVAAKIRVKSDSPTVYKTMLRVDPQVTKELGDEFPVR